MSVREMKTNPDISASRILVGDVLDGLRSLPDGCVHCCVTSPPYWGLRDYGVEGQIGLEATPDAFVARMVEVFGEVRRVLREDATLWLNLGDSYNAGTSSSRKPSPDVEHGYWENGGTMGDRRVKCPGLKVKDLCMMPWRVALALQADGWWIRSVIVWAKKSPMPESCRDRPTSAWEPIFLLTKSASYFYDAEAVKEFGAGRETFGNWIKGMPCPDRNDNQRQNMEPTLTRNLRNVWHLGPEPYAEAHFATFPTEIPRRAIKAGTSEKGCCPACGAGWVRQVEREFEQTQNGIRSDAKGLDESNGLAEYPRGRNHVRTLGWSPSCECNAGDPVPALVLDPFLGSGTTVAVARELGRHGVGCELNEEYAKLARERIGRAEKPQTFRSEKASDAPLFKETA